MPLAFLTVWLIFFLPHALPLQVATIFEPAGTLFTRNTVNLVNFAPGRGS